jgi:hypothetical protein
MRIKHQTAECASTASTINGEKYDQNERQAGQYAVFQWHRSFPLSAYAYLDPGTGSAILQGLIAALSAVLVAGHLYWSRFLELLGRGKKKQGDADAEEKAKPEDSDSKVG